MQFVCSLVKNNAPCVRYKVVLLIVSQADKLARYFLSPQENRSVTSCLHKSWVLALMWCANKLWIISTVSVSLPLVGW